MATLAVMDRSTHRYLLFNAEQALVGWRNLSTGQEKVVREGPSMPLAFSGIQVLSPAVFDYMMDEPDPFSLTRPYLKAATAGAPVYGFRMDGSEWMDVGTPERLDSLRRKLETAA